MNPTFIYYTGNAGKFQEVSAFLAGQRSSMRLIKPSDYCNILEVDDARLNARMKASAGVYKYPSSHILSTDDALYLEGFPEKLQPGAKIRRIIPRKGTDKNVVSWYEKQLQLLGIKSLCATITSCFCVINPYGDVKEMEISYEFEFRIPPHKDFLLGMPLSAFHFVPQYNLYYPELSREQKLELLLKRWKDLPSFLESSSVEKQKTLIS